MDNNAFYKKVVQRYLDGTASKEEQEVFVHLLNEGKLDEYLRMDMEEGAGVTPLTQPSRRTHRLHRLQKYGVAATVVLALIIAARYMTHRKHPDKTAVIQNIFKNDVRPGGNHAVLTLADGTHITLDSAGKGNLASQGGARIVQTTPGSLSYTVVHNTASSVYYNTVATPAGGKYEITLADGTRVWLNALSSLTFPTSFTDRVRTVQLTGEAYFEVARDNQHPFRVTTGGMEVRVLGTAFNVNAYSDEPSTRTALVEGSVKLVKGKDNMILQPGQLGESAGSGTLALVKDGDIEQALAWKNGYFSFDGADIRTIMRQIARWYNVDVRYEGNPGSGLFGGQIGRDLNLTEVLTGLSKSNVHFRLEGNVLTVLP